MSLHDAAWAVREAMKICEAAEDMVAAGAVGDVLADFLTHAKELLDIADKELVEIDSQRFPALADAAPALRARVRAIRGRIS